MWHGTKSIPKGHPNSTYRKTLEGSSIMCVCTHNPHYYVCVLMCSEFLLICHCFICQTFQSTTISQDQYNIQVLTDIQLNCQTY